VSELVYPSECMVAAWCRSKKGPWTCSLFEVTRLSWFRHLFEQAEAVGLPRLTCAARAALVASVASRWAIGIATTACAS
jgi:hypothetical protein